MSFSPGVEKFRLAVVVIDPNNGISLMRGMGPLTAMAREDRRLELVLPPMTENGIVLGWSWLAQCDALFISAPYTPNHARCVVLAKMMGLPVWVDWDDDLCCVPIYNPAHGRFDPEQIAPILEKLCQLADQITVSTEAIRLRRIVIADHEPHQGSAGRIEDKIQVLPNACQWPMSETPRIRRVVWRGWGNHDADLLDVLPEIKDVAELPEFRNWKWTFLGEPPWQVKEMVPEENLEIDPGADPFLYMGLLDRLRPWIQIVPLRDNSFNRCRSNLAWLEASAAGAAVLAPHWDEWQRPGITTYAPGHFGQVLKLMMTGYRLGIAVKSVGTRAADGPRSIDSTVTDSREFIRENLTLEQLNVKRWQILNGFTRQQETKP